MFGSFFTGPVVGGKVVFGEQLFRFAGLGFFGGRRDGRRRHDRLFCHRCNFDGLSGRRRFGSGLNHFGSLRGSGFAGTGVRHSLLWQGGNLLFDRSDDGSFGGSGRCRDGRFCPGSLGRCFDLATVPGSPEYEQRKGQHGGRGGSSHREASEQDLATAAVKPYADAFPDIRRWFGHPFEAIAQPLVKIIVYHDITVLSFLATGFWHGSAGNVKTAR